MTDRDRKSGRSAGTLFSSAAFPLAFLAAVGFLLWVPAWLGFPSVISDTLTYLEEFQNAAKLPTRPPWYGFLLESVDRWNWWGIAILQAGLVTWLAVRAVAVIGGDERRGKFAGVLSLLLVSGVTAASCSITRLVPDFLAPALLLSSLLLIYGNLADKLLSAAVMLAAVLTHSSHFAVAVLLTALVSIAWALGWLREARPRWLLATLVAAMVAVPAANWIRYGQFRFSFSTGPFVANRLRDMGLLERYLDETCTGSRHQLCAYRGNLGGTLGFLWRGNRERSVVEAVGGWSGDGYLEDVALAVVRRYPLRVAWDTGVSLFRQLFSFNMVVDSRHLIEGRVLAATDTLAETFEKGAAGRRAAWPKMNVWVNGMQNVILGLAGVLSAWLWFFTPVALRPRIRFVLLLAVAFLLMNAGVCAGLSGVFPRYQSRVNWLLPFLSIALVLAVRPTRHSRKTSQ